MEPVTLPIGGLTPYTATDYPGCLAAIVFCQGCNWRCRYCHNPHLLPMRAPATVAWNDVVQLLLRRQGLLDAVVFSGGEPTLHDGLADAVQAVRDMGFRVGLHTAGSNPERLRELLTLVDWVGMDVKAPFADYKRITGITNSGKLAQQSVRFILESSVACEFRTTVHSALLSPQQWLQLGRELAEMGVHHYVLQEFRQQGCIRTLPVSTAAHLHVDVMDALRKLFPKFTVRTTT